jgi:Domain of unknown function (DUF4411)
MLYLLDANVIITAKDSYYAMDQVPQFWEWLVHHGKRGNLKIPRELLGEVNEGSDKLHPFYAWRKDKLHIDSLQLNEEVDTKILQRVLDDGYGRDLTDADLGTIGRDPFLIAYALAKKDRVVVTTEVSKPSQKRQNRKIPDVCEQLGVTCLNTFQMTRALDWKTNWEP